MDCLDWTRSQPDNALDLVIGSPPYEDARLYGDLKFKLKGQAWVDWAVERFIDQYRVCKGLVCWVVEGKTRNFRWSASPALLMADLHRAGIKLRKPPIFHKVGIPGSGGPDWWRNDYEFVICASKGRLPWSNNTATGHVPKYGPGGAMSYRRKDGDRRNQWGGRLRGIAAKDVNGELVVTPRPSHISTTELKVYNPPKLANPGNVLKCAVGGSKMGSKLAHKNEAPFPETLIHPFVVSFCPPGGLVYDPFSGSGTTAAVCAKNNRRFVGTEIRADQVALTQQRVA